MWGRGLACAPGSLQPSIVLYRPALPRIASYWRRTKAGPSQLGFTRHCSETSLKSSFAESAAARTERGLDVWLPCGTPSISQRAREALISYQVPASGDWPSPIARALVSLSTPCQRPHDARIGRAGTPLSRTHIPVRSPPERPAMQREPSVSPILNTSRYGDYPPQPSPQGDV